MLFILALLIIVNFLLMFISIFRSQINEFLINHGKKK